MEKKSLNRAQRMQMKAFICVLGVLLLIILAVGKLAVTLLHRDSGESETEEPHIPVVQELANVWIMGESEEGISVFRDGERESYAWGLVPESGQTDSGRTDNGRTDSGIRSEAEPELWYRPKEPVREQVADIVLTDGLVTEIRLKKEKINGKVLGADENGIEIEGYGRVPLAADYKGYRLYDSLEMCTARDVFFGYDFTDFCMEDGEICGILMVKEEAMKYIRVLIKADGYAGMLHVSPEITADTGFQILYGSPSNRISESHAAGETIEFSYDSSYFAEADRVWIIPEVLTGKTLLANVNRSQGTPAYRGQLELLRTEEGIAIVNEVLLEDYLYSVVPSEMPAGYPAEALKAQAICARTYAYGHMEHAGLPQYGAHVDDSTSYQVYNNILEQESTTTAVKETYGKLLFTETGTLAGTYYYSTSCGVGSDATVWKTESAKQITYLHAKELSHAAMEEERAALGQDAGTGDLQETSADAGAADAESADAEAALGETLREEEAFAAFIRTKNPDAFEAEEGWYRWSYKVEKLDTAHMREALQKRYAANSKLVLTREEGEYVSKDIGKLEDITAIYIEKRGAGGVADELVIETEEETYKVISEHNIRYVLNDGESEISRQDGNRIPSPNLLPSGFFVIETGKEDGNVVGYTLTGGGFGHGVGMSQNGARNMAKSGYGAEEILLYFYEDCVLKSIYE